MPNGIDGLILTGGMSRRMGQDKSHLIVAGESLLTHHRRLICPEVERLFIATNQKVKAINPALRTNECFIEDYYQTSEGPLSGVLSGLESSGAELLWVVSCDHYGLPKNILLKLTDALAGSGADIACVKSQGRRQPLICLMRIDSVKGHVKSYCRSGARSVLGCYDGLDVVDVVLDDLDFWANLNTQDDYAQLLVFLEGKS